VQHTSQPQFVVQSYKDQNEAKTFIILDQPPKISSPKLATNQGRAIIGGINIGLYTNLHL